MQKYVLIFLISVLAAAVSYAQSFDFDLNTRNYVPLSGGTELLFSGNQDPDPVVLDMAMSFNGASLEYFQVVDGVLIMLNLQTFDNINLYPANANLFSQQGTTRYFYKIEGQFPNRTMILECQNVKFRDERDETGASPSFMTYQIYVFEGLGGVMFHYGPSSINDFNLCFKKEGGCRTGWLDNVDTFRELKGQPTNPQNIVITNMSAEHPTMNAYPETGTMYIWGDERTSSHRGFIPEDLKIFPNITKGLVNISDSQISDSKSKVRVYNTSGQLLKIESINKYGQIDLGNLSPGVYQLIINKGAIQYNAKVVKM